MFGREPIHKLYLWNTSFKTNLKTLTCSGSSSSVRASVSQSVRTSARYSVQLSSAAQISSAQLSLAIRFLFCTSKFKLPNWFSRLGNEIRWYIFVLSVLCDTVVKRLIWSIFSWLLDGRGCIFRKHMPKVWNTTQKIDMIYFFDFYVYIYIYMVLAKTSTTPLQNLIKFDHINLFTTVSRFLLGFLRFSWTSQNNLVKSVIQL